MRAAHSALGIAFLFKRHPWVEPGSNSVASPLSLYLHTTLGGERKGVEGVAKMQWGKAWGAYCSTRCRRLTLACSNGMSHMSALRPMK